jgi:hypothetical protein
MAKLVSASSSIEPPHTVEATEGWTLAANSIAELDCSHNIDTASTTAAMATGRREYMENIRRNAGGTAEHGMGPKVTTVEQAPEWVTIQPDMAEIWNATDSTWPSLHRSRTQMPGSRAISGQTAVVCRLIIKGFSGRPGA